MITLFISSFVSLNVWIFLGKLFSDEDWEFILLSLLKKIKNVIIGILKEFVNLQESLFKTYQKCTTENIFEVAHQIIKELLFSVKAIKWYFFFYWT